MKHIRYRIKLWYWNCIKGHSLRMCLGCKDHLFRTRNPWRKFCSKLCKQEYKKGYVLDNCNF